MKQRKGGWIQTYTGKQFWPIDPRPEDVDLIDVAHALSNLCRYAGHTRKFYSVAQHSVLVSQIVHTEDAVWGLLHDAAEAYVIDMPRPIKHDPGAFWYREVERRVMDVICERFNLSPIQPASISWADEVLLSTERRDLMVASTAWSPHLEPMARTIIPEDPECAKQMFLERAMSLGVKE